MKRNYWLFLALLSLNSCKDEIAEPESLTKFDEKELEEFNIKALYSTNHTISREEAEKMVLDFVNQPDENGNCLKSSKGVTIANTVVRGSKGLKSSKVNSQDTLGYFVNFAGDNGYAYVCADDRVNNGVFAVFDHGNYESNNASDSLIAPIYSMMDNYASSSIKEFEEKKAYRLAMVEGAIKNGKLDTSKNSLKSFLTSQVVSVQLGPLLCTELSQGSVESSLLDNCTCSDNCVRNQQKVKPGCVTIALTQLMVFWEDGWRSKYATSSTISNQYIDFGKVLLEEDSPYEIVNRSRREAKAEAVRYFYNQIKDYDGIDSKSHIATGMYSDVIKKISISSHYNISDKEPFSTTKAVEWLSKYKTPLFIEGECYEITDDEEFHWQEKDHMWLIDGSMMRVKLKAAKIESTSIMFHHNWGWGGLYNGWFNNDLFIKTDMKGDVGYKNLETWGMIHKDWESGRKPAHSNYK